MMRPYSIGAVLVGMCLAILMSSGCQAAHKTRRRADKHIVRHVVCLYDTKPWLNLDRMGDRDPEGFKYRIFLMNSSGRSLMKDGMFHIEMYLVDRDAENNLRRTLVSDWHYPTIDVHTIARPGIMGVGYFPHLYWSKKEIAGNEVEVITTFEDESGNRCRSETKRLRVPRYKS